VESKVAGLVERRLPHHFPVARHLLAQSRCLVLNAGYLLS